MTIITLIRSILATGFFFVHTLFCALMVIILAGVFRSRKHSDIFIRWVWARFTLWLTGIKVEVRGLEQWPTQGGFLIAFSHASWVDIIAMAAHLPKVPRFGAKIELYSIPLFGRAMRIVGMLPIERNNRKRVLKIYSEASSRAAAGEVFALAPEGTRQKGHTIGRLKTGPFLFALGAEIPIVGLLIAGALDTMPKDSWLLNPWRWKSRVILQVCPAIETKGKTDSDIPQLQEALLSRWHPLYQELNRELGLTV